MTLTLNKPTPGEVEQRSAPAELTIDGNRLSGLIPYSVESRDLGGWKEVIEPRALASADLSDLVATLNHQGIPLGRYATTLNVEDRSDGLAWSVELGDGPTAQDVRAAVARGDLRESSWRMVVARDRWDGPVRHVEEIRALKDVAVVTTGAYPADATRVELREHPEPKPANTPTNTTTPEEGEVKPENREKPRGGGLTVEDRTAPADANIETRVLDAMRAVPKGEARSLTHATIDSEPIEPAELATYLWSLLRQPSVLLSTGIPIIPTDRKVFTWPTLLEDIEVGFVGELEEIPEHDPDLDEFSLEPKGIKGRTVGSSESFEDSADPALLDIVQSSMLAAMALKLDAEGIVGGSAKGFNGMLKFAERQTLNAAEALLDSYDAIIAGVGLLLEANVPGPYVTLMHPRLATHFDRLRQQGVVAGEKEAEKVAVNSPLPRPDSLPPVYTTAALPITKGKEEKPDTSSIVIYAPAQLACVRRREATVEVSREAEWDTDGVSVRGKVRAIIGTPHEEAVVEIQKVATPEISLA